MKLSKHLLLKKVLDFGQLLANKHTSRIPLFCLLIKNILQKIKSKRVLTF
jgi:hypothetical protein